VSCRHVIKTAGVATGTRGPGPSSPLAPPPGVWCNSHLTPNSVLSHGEEGEDAKWEWVPSLLRHRFIHFRNGQFLWKIRVCAAKNLIEALNKKMIASVLSIKLNFLLPHLGLTDKYFIKNIMQRCCWTSSQRPCYGKLQNLLHRESPHQPFFMSSSTRQHCCFPSTRYHLGTLVFSGWWRRERESERASERGENKKKKRHPPLLRNQWDCAASDC